LSKAVRRNAASYDSWQFFCRGVFRYQLRSSLTANRRLIAFDLPGCGQSSNAPDPERTYTHYGIVDAVVELLAKLGISKVIVLGWSLGGHLGLDMIPRFPGLRGLMITGTSPAGLDEIARAYKHVCDALIPEAARKIFKCVNGLATFTGDR